MITVRRMLCLALVGASMAQAFPSSSAAQEATAPSRQRPATGVYLSGRIGIAFYGGDLDASNFRKEITSQAVAGELFGQLLPWVGVGIGYQSATYPRLSTLEAPARGLETLQFFLRINPTSGRIAPYFNLGAHRTNGGVETGTGPVAGMGLNLRLERKLYLFSEGTVNFVIPDRALDGVESGTGFDAIGFFGFGVRIANLGVRYNRPARIRAIDAPFRLEADEVYTFKAHLERRAAQPVSYTWTMGDGTLKTGEVIEHAYGMPGEYQVELVAENARGRDVEEITLVVQPRPEAIEPPVAVAEDRLVEPGAVNPIAAFFADAGPGSMESEGLSYFTWIVAAQSAPVEAERVAESYQDRGYQSRVVPAEVNGRTTYRVAIGDYETREEARHARQQDASGNLPVDAWLLYVEPPVVTDTLPASTETESVEPLPTKTAPAAPTAEPYFTWIVASWSNQEEARRVADEYAEQGVESRVIPAVVNGQTVYRVALGRYETRSAANAARESLPSRTPPHAWIVQVNLDD